MAKTILTPLQKKILSTLTDDPNLIDNFYLTGGTALSEFYLHHRLSEDLDLFSEKEIDTLWLTTLATQVKQKTNATKIDLQRSFNRNLIFFSFGNQVIKTEFTYYPFTQLEKPKPFKTLKIDSLLDIAVNKFFTIYQQPSARHFIDLYLIIQEGITAWEELPKLARLKFDTVIDPLQLGSQLTVSQEIHDLPKMLIKLENDKWRNFYLKQAMELKKVIEK